MAASGRPSGRRDVQIPLWQNGNQSGSEKSTCDLYLVSLSIIVVAITLERMDPIPLSAKVISTPHPTPVEVLDAGVNA